jgi:hypothetical protein
VTNEPLQGAIQTGEATAVAIAPQSAPLDRAPQPADVTATLEPVPPAAVAEIEDATVSSVDGALRAAEPEPMRSTEDNALEKSEPVVTPELSTAQEFDPSPSLVPSLIESPDLAQTLDFASLVARLRKTKAINLRTKVAVRNESDELLEQFRAYHAQTGETSLADLRRIYDSLFHELHSLLEDADPPLARDIDRSQAAIWELLADPAKFRASNLMAGA